MARTNTQKVADSKAPKTHEGAPAKIINARQQLRRTVMSCLLWENEFYESGVSIADRIKQLVQSVSPEDVATIAIDARNSFKLRHVPLLLVREMARHVTHRKYVRQTLRSVIQRADELSEFLSLYWSEGKVPLAASVKKGLADAFRTFDSYQLAKYNRDNPVKLRDVLFLTHAKPRDTDQATAWKKLASKTLESPDTWEVALSGGADKKETFTRLLRENKLGYLALLRNLRNMVQAGVDERLVREAILARSGAGNVLPFRYVAAARHAPQFENELDVALRSSIESQEPLDGLTVILVDVSGSMDEKLSGKSELKRIDAAATLASIIPGQRRVLTFSNSIVEVPPRYGMAGVEAVINSQRHGGTELGKAIQYVNANINYDRLIVITDEQSHDRVGGPKGKGYMINVASYQNGVGYGPWVHIDGFSESVINFIRNYEIERKAGTFDNLD